MTPRVTYHAKRTTGYVAKVDCGGEQLTIEASEGDTPTITGSDRLVSNVALISYLRAHAENELASRRTRSGEKRKSHSEAAKTSKRNAEAIAEMVLRLGSTTSVAWCSACFERRVRYRVNGMNRPATFLCGQCGTPTAQCAVPSCRNHAVLKPTARVNLVYCAAHRHEIPSFEKLGESFHDLDDAEEWLQFDQINAGRWTKVAVGVVGAGIVLAPAAWFAAPVIGSALGGSALGGGLSGAAATSHGLAMLGGGSIASGGAGVMGGTYVVTATGTALGGVLGGTATTAYVRADKSFEIKKLRDGEGPAVLLASGFLTEGDEGWGSWQAMIDERFPGSPVYRVHWGSKELKSIAILGTTGAGKVAARKVLTSAAKRGSKKLGSLPVIGGILFAHDVAVNPWSLAKNRAAMTGAILADLIARTSDQQFILVGHSLGARVMVHAAQTLGTRTRDNPRIEEMHLLGAAVGADGDWATLQAAVRGNVYNYWSRNDKVLSAIYRTAQLGQKAVGYAGFNSTWPTIKDRNVTRTVPGHTRYTDGVVLVRPREESD